MRSESRAPARAAYHAAHRSGVTGSASCLVGQQSTVEPAACADAVRAESRDSARAVAGGAEPIRSAVRAVPWCAAEHHEAAALAAAGPI